MTQKTLNPILLKNANSPFLIEKIIKNYLGYKFSSNQNQLKAKSDVHCFKLPYIDNLSHHIKNKLLKFCKEFFKENFNFKLVFNSFKIKNYFSYKDSISNDFKSFLVYKFTCASCLQFQLYWRNLSSLHDFTATCFDSYKCLCFKIADKANSKIDLKIKEALHVNWRKPKLNAQQNHLPLTLSLQLLFPLLHSVFVYFSFVVFCIFL